jgi:Protein of unknown function (DUF3450)
MTENRTDSRAPRRGRRQACALLALTAASSLLASAPMTAQQDGGPAPTAQLLEETRLKMGKWIETQQIITKERKDWQQGKEILLGRLELVKQEVTSLQEKIAQARSSAGETAREREEVLSQDQVLKDALNWLGAAADRLEVDVQRLLKPAPTPIQEKLARLIERMPKEGAKDRVTVAERYQNVIAILNELNKANTDITVSYEIRTLEGNRQAEVRALYVGLAVAYYVSANGEAGIGRPTADGWTWEPSKELAEPVLLALDILQGKHTPEFVPLPARLQ